MNSKKYISILGVGWLGLPLAKRLLAKDHKIKGSTTSVDKLSILKDQGVHAYQIRIAADKISGDIEDFLAETKVLIIDFPPGLRKDPGSDYYGAILRLSKVLATSGVEKVIFISSISVYEETESFRIYTEEANTIPGSASGKEVMRAEKVLLEHPAFATTIIRFGGLIGPGRHPVNYLSGKKGLSNPLGPVNLIHLSDCLKVIEKVLEKNRYGEVYNAVFPLHPSREEYYIEAARKAGLSIPEFDHSKPSVGKIIAASKVVRELGVEFTEGI